MGVSLGSLGWAGAGNRDVEVPLEKVEAPGHLLLHAGEVI